VVARSGAATVSELAGLGIPSVFVPYPVGNGEQELNARESVNAGGAILCADTDFSPEWVRHSLIPLLGDASRRADMAARAATAGIRDGAERLAALVLAVAVKQRR
jgi:UDP-N-acetylglucosamine--N-acetylmuramyl-(pentapeptide) pyrophosphoryl-undecaprenol N-acetylglucosamine transferase